jgi:hypothetical protein
MARSPNAVPLSRPTQSLSDGQHFEPLAKFRPDLPPAFRDDAAEPHGVLREECNEPLGALTPTGFVSSQPSRTVCHVSSSRPSGPGFRRSQGRLCRLVASTLHEADARRAFPHGPRRRSCPAVPCSIQAPGLDAQECLTGILSAHTRYCNNASPVNVHPENDLHRIERNPGANRSARIGVPNQMR